jgi:hypothetical protein
VNSERFFTLVTYFLCERDLLIRCVIFPVSKFIKGQITATEPKHVVVNTLIKLELCVTVVIHILEMKHTSF